MAITETQRTTLYSQLTDAIGQEAARTLMEQLPPSGWDQVATKDDVKASERLLQRELKASERLLQRELKASEKMLHGELKELARHTRWMAAVLLGFAVSMAVPLTIALL